MQGSEYKANYQQLEIIGNHPQDQFKLYLIRELKTGNYLMAKKMSIYQTSDNFQDQTLNEVKILKDLKNPHVIKYHDVMLENDQFITILQFCEQGDLEYYLKRRKDRKDHLSEKLILSWLMQLLMALQYIHSKNIIHRMVCSRNVYLNHQGDLKLGSFGRARTLQSTLEKAMTVVGSPCNLSPQAVQGNPYDNKLDIWALGCLVYELATFNHPYKIKNLPQLYQMIVKNPPLELPVKYSKYLNPIYKKMMKKHPNSRPSAKQLLEEKVFLKLMHEYTKKRKIDALDLRQITPKQLAIHKRKKQQKTNKVTLPPLTPSPNNTSRKQCKQHRYQKSNVRDKSLGKSKQKIMKKDKSKEKINKKNIVDQQIKPTKTKITKEQEKMTPQAKVKIQNSPKDETNREEDRSLSDSNVSNSQRITQPKIDQIQYISLLYQLKLELLQKKYSPLMSQIFQQAVQFDQE